jgi:hypothetical protein
VEIEVARLETSAALAGAGALAVASVCRFIGEASCGRAWALRQVVGPPLGLPVCGVPVRVGATMAAMLRRS